MHFNAPNLLNIIAEPSLNALITPIDTLAYNWAKSSNTRASPVAEQ